VVAKKEGKEKISKGSCKIFYILSSLSCCLFH